ncbi:MAG: hypothetical protein RL687_201 [Candidatus Parcubacteria bacterium]
MKKYFIFFSILGIFVSAHRASADTYTYIDKNNDGTVDTIRIETSGEYYMSCPFESGDWVINNSGSIGITSINGIYCKEQTPILDISVTAKSGTTGGPVDPIISYKYQGQTQIGMESGNMVENYNQKVSDGALPIILSVFPTNNSSNQNRSANIVINFSEEMKISTVSYNINPYYVHTPSWSTDNKTMTLSHGAYDVNSVVSAKLLAGKSTNNQSVYGLPYVWSWNTNLGSTGGGNNTGGGSSTGGGSYTGGGVSTGGYVSTNRVSNTGGSNDTTPPTNTYLFINKKAGITNSPNVNLELLAIGARDMIISEDPNFKYDMWRPYAYNFTWTFSNKTNGVKTLYAKFRDDSNNVSNPIAASINLINTAPTLTGKTFSFLTTLNNRSPKQTIKNMQIALNMDLAATMPKLLKVDGVWGKSTTDALMLFQKKNGIFPDGVAGWTTRTKLSQVIVQ